MNSHYSSINMLSESLLLTIFKELLKIIQKMKFCGVLHGDIHPSNIEIFFDFKENKFKLELINYFNE